MTTEMKPSGIDGFFDIPADWEVNRMAYVFSFGKGLSITKENLQDEGIPAISYGDIHSRYGFEVNPKIHELRCVDPKYLKSDRNALLRFGDFIFADTSEDIIGSGNFTHLNSNETTFASYHTITARAIRTIDYRYMAYLFDSEPFRAQIRNKVSGVKVFSITQLILKNAKLLLPSLSEQQAIAVFLDKICSEIDTVISDLELQVEILQKYKKALITETVTKGLDKSVPMKDSGVNWIGEMPEHWELRRLKYCSSIKTGSTPQMEHEEYYSDGSGIEWIKPDNLFGLNGVSKSTLKLTSQGAKQARILPPNTILICCIGSIGKYSYISEPSAFNQQINGLIFNDDFFWKYGLYYMSTQEDQQKLMATGNVVAILNGENQKQLIVTVPPTKEQTEISDYLDTKCAEADTLISEKQHSIDIMRKYKKSLIYEYVTGKKRVPHATNKHKED